ncbi:MAG: signal peptidase I [Spirochaetaceae bacterium]|jgi:signal peptidase I|nr:signal peptidase I [Spirochaetaceae bacterium]
MKTDMKNTVVAVCCAFIVGFFIRFFIFDLMIVEGESMYPTLKSGAVVLVVKTAYGLRLPGFNTYLLHWAEPKQDEIVVFWTLDRKAVVKRCAGLSDQYNFIALGDNRAISLDSRAYGPVPIDQIIGKVFTLKRNATEKKPDTNNTISRVSPISTGWILQIGVWLCRGLTYPYGSK